MKAYFSSILSKTVKTGTVKDTYLDVLTRTSAQGLLVGHPGIINENKYLGLKYNRNNVVSISFPFAPPCTGDGYNASYGFMIKDIMVMGESKISEIKPVVTHNLSIDVLNKATAQLGNNPIVFKATGRKSAVTAVEAIHKFINSFKYVRVFNKTIRDYIDRYNHSLFIEIYPMHLCIPIFNPREVDGFGLSLRIIGDSGFVIKYDSMVVSQYKSNIFVVDGSTICNNTGLPKNAIEDIRHYVVKFCPRNESARARKAGISSNAPKIEVPNLASATLPKNEFSRSTGSRDSKTTEVPMDMNGVPSPEVYKPKSSRAHGNKKKPKNLFVSGKKLSSIDYSSPVLGRTPPTDEAPSKLSRERALGTRDAEALGFSFAGNIESNTVTLSGRTVTESATNNPWTTSQHNKRLHPVPPQEPDSTQPSYEDAYGKKWEISYELGQTSTSVSETYREVIDNAVVGNGPDQDITVFIKGCTEEHDNPLHCYETDLAEEQINLDKQSNVLSATNVNPSANASYAASTSPPTNDDSF